MKLPRFVVGILIAVAFFLAASLAQTQPEKVVINARMPGRPFPHFWEQTFGSGRAILALREGYRNDLIEVKKVTEFSYVRFHNILHDEVGVYDEDEQGHPIYNFSYVDQIYDGLLKNGVRPFVEISFMPKKLALRQDVHPFWYKQIVSPPKDYKKWDDLIRALGQHLVDRYGLDEVAQWYFEVWNEPNIDFWSGDPKQATYFELYDHTALALKSVSQRLRVGGPATSSAHWVDAFIQHAVAQNAPSDFISSHVYGNDSAPDVFGTHEQIPRTQMVCRAVRKVHDQIAASARPNLPLIWSEFNASYMNEPDVTDSTYMGPWMADTIRQCDGLVDMMSYWTFSDVFEEQGVVKRPIYGGYGLIAEDGLPKPAFNAFKLLHRLGETRIPANADDIIATRRADGAIVIAVWNTPVVGGGGESKEVVLQLNSLKGRQKASVYRVDADHGSLLKAYASMGSPVYPTSAQIQTLRQAAQLPKPETVPLRSGQIALHLAPDALVLLEVR